MDDENIKPEKFIYANPQIGKRFSYEIFRRKEYYDNKLGPIEPITGEKGVPLLSQKLASIFFSKYTQYKSGLFYHEPGTGKSCLSSFIIENFKDTIVNDNPRKPALIIVPNETLEKNYRRDVEKQCTKKGTYMAQLTKAEKQKVLETGEAISLNEETKQRRLKVAISKTYEIVSHETFLTHLPQSDEQIKREYSNRIIVIDEAHHFRMQTASGEGKRKKATLIDKVLGREPGISKELYTILHKFLHTVENCRILLLTGTPIWDQVYEISSLMNLVLDSDNQLPRRNKFLSEYFDEDKNLIPDKKEELREKFKGIVSYLRPMMTTASRKEEGTSDPWLKRLKVYPSTMSDFQFKNYEKAVADVKITTFNYTTKSGKKITVEREIQGGAMRLLARDASTFVFPVLGKDGSLVKGIYGKEGYESNIVYNKQNHTYRYKNSQISNFIKNNLKILSSKFYSLIKTIKEHPDELVFIYDEYIASGGGVINLALVLEQHGFIWAKSVSDIKHKSSQKRFCAMTSYEGTLNSPKQIQLFINSFNQDDNKYGERCQIIIGSRKIAEGITIKNVRQGHIIIGHWNIPSIDQALGRIFRVGSHDSFSKKEEKYIRIYKHVSVRKGDIENEFTEPFSNEKTLDLTIYGIAEEKEYCNTQIYRILKEVAWDCPLVYGRNVLEGDEDYTRNSDYDTKNYKCYDYPKKYIDKQGDVWKYNVPEKKIIRDTYDLFYNNSEVTKLIEKIKKIFEKNSSYHLSQFYQLLDLEKKDEFLLLKTVDYLIMSKTKIKNRYGFLLTLNEYKNIYYLDDTIGIMPEYSSLVYKETPMISEITSLKELSNINQYTSDAENIKNFCKNPSIENIKKMNYRTLILLLETAYKLKSTKLSMSREEAAAIENVMKVLGSNLFYLDDGQKVIHVMYNTEYMGLGYNVVLQEINPNGNMRLFENGKWSYVKNIEDEERYIKQFKTSKKVNTEEWDDFVQGIYGFTDKDGKFKIKVKPLPGQRMTKGSVCEEASWSIPKLYDVINKLNALPSPNEKFDKLSKEELIERIQAQPQLSIFLNKDRSAKELKQIITLNTMDRKKICAFLQNWFRENKMYKENVV